MKKRPANASRIAARGGLFAGQYKSNHFLSCGCLRAGENRRVFALCGKRKKNGGGTGHKFKNKAAAADPKKNNLDFGRSKKFRQPVFTLRRAARGRERPLSLKGFWATAGV